MADLRFDVSAETKAATAALGSFAQDIQKKLVNAVRSLPDIELTADSSDAQRKMKELRDELAALANKKVGVDIDAGDALAEMQRLQTELRTLGGSTTEVGVRADVDAATRALGDVEAETRRLNGTDVEVEVTADTSAAEQDLGGFADAAKVGAAAAGVAIGATLAAGLANAMEFESAAAKLEAQLGGMGSIAQDAGVIAGNLYANAYGESLAEVGEAVPLVVKSGAVMEDATNEQIQSITGRVMSLAQAFEQDLGGTVNAVGQMVRTGLADNAEQALDILTRGFQEGNDKAGDLLDTFNEYSGQFQKLGVDGETAMGLISQGLRGGARDADIVADAFKEFSIRAIDGSTATAEAFQGLGLDAADMAGKIAAGGPVAAAALDLTLDKLRAIEDPTQRAAIAVGLFGTQSEDLGAALFELDPTTAILGNVAGAAERLDAALGETAEAKVTALQRGWERWTGTLIESQGPIGDVAAGIAAFGPMAMGAVAAIAPLVLALKMGGVAAAISGVSTAAAGTGAAAGAAAGGASRLAGALKFVGVAGAIGGVALAIDGVNTSAANGADRLDGWAADLHEVAKLLHGDFTSLQDPIGEIGSEWDQLVRDFQTGTSDAGRMWAEFQREMSGFELTDINVDIDANAEAAKEVIDGLIAEVNGATAQVNINGNDTGAAFALRQILSEIAGGAESVLINGEPMPALEALDYVKGLITNSTGEVTINGQTMPAGEALSMLMGQIAATQGRVLVGANIDEAYGQLTTVQGQINSTMGTVTINGNRMPADQSLGAVLAAIDSGAAEVDINGTSVPAGLALTNLLSQIDAGAGTVTINGNRVPAGQALAALVQTISASQGTSTINGNATKGYTALSGFLATGNRAVTTPQVNANTANARSQLNSFIASFQGRTIDLRVSTAGRLAAGGIVSPETTRARFYASGGVDRPMKSMPVGIPAVAQPGMLRVFGDRSDVNESYIPWKKGDRRATDLLAITAAALGYATVPRAALLASGGVVAPGGRVVHGTVSQMEWDALKAQGWKGRRGDSVEALYAPTPSASTARVAAAVNAAPLSRAAAGAVAVADAATRAEVAALRRDLASSNYGAAQLAALHSVAAAVASARTAGALATANAAGARAEGGAW